jgi:hypothetical protein
MMEDEPEKSSVVCPSSRTKGIAGNGAIRTVNKAVNNVLKAQVEPGMVILR